MIKTGRARHVPFSDASVMILKSLPSYDDGPFVLLNPKTMQPFHTFFNAWNTARIRAGVADLRVHDPLRAFLQRDAAHGRRCFGCQRLKCYRLIQLASHAGDPASLEELAPFYF